MGSHRGRDRQVPSGSILRPMSIGRHRGKLAILATVLAAFLTAACSSDTEPTDTGGSPAAGNEQGCEAPVETATIRIANLAFDPSCIALPADTETLAVENTDDTAHTFTISEVDLNADIDPGENVQVDVAAINAGVWPFRCSIHPQMTGFLTRN